MGLLDDFSAALQGAVDFTFTDCVLTAGNGTHTPNGSGGFTDGTATHNCRGRLNRKETRAAEGGLVYVTQIIILRGSLTVVPAEGNKITGLGRAYVLGRTHLDGLGSHWVCEVVDG